MVLQLLIYLNNFFSVYHQIFSSVAVTTALSGAAITEAVLSGVAIIAEIFSGAATVTAVFSVAVFSFFLSDCPVNMMTLPNILLRWKAFS